MRVISLVATGKLVTISARVDEVNGRIVVAEAFIYAPESQKRDLMRRMEAALYTLQLPRQEKVNNMTYNLEEIVIEPEFN